jgi:hypothetical protein
MGNSNSTKISQMVDVVNSISVAVNNSAITSGNAISLNRQSFIFDNYGQILGCDFDSGQTLQADQGLKVASTFNSSTDLKNNLKNMVDQIAASSQKAVSEFISLTSNSNESEMDLKVSLKNDIDTKITNENVTTCKAFIDNLQEGKFYNRPGAIFQCRSGGFIRINQNIINEQNAECLSSTFINVVNQNDIFNRIKQKAESEQSAEIIGPFTALSNFAKSIAGIITIVIVVIVLGLGAALLIFLLTKSSGKK